jgi:hypothetical protein
MAFAAWLAETGKPRAAGLAVLGTLVEPHVGLGACLAFAIAAREARLPMLAGAVLLAVVSIVATGWDLGLEYARVVLPRHAASEIAHQSQLSLTHLVHLAGFNDRIALEAGSFSFVAMLVAGVWLAVRLGRRSGFTGFTIALPPVFALIGGTYIHANQMCLALPAALLAFARFPAWRVPAGFAVCLLAIPWSEATIVDDQPIATVLTIAVLAFCLTRGKLLATALGAGAAALVVVLCDVFIGPQSAAAVRAFRPAIGLDGFVDDEWRQFVAVEFADHSVLYLALGSLTWLGLGLLAYVLVRAVVRRAPA